MSATRADTGPFLSLKTNLTSRLSTSNDFATVGKLTEVVLLGREILVFVEDLARLSAEFRRILLTL